MMRIGKHNWRRRVRPGKMQALPARQESTMSQAVSTSFRRHPLRLLVGVAINLGGMLVLAAHL